MSGAPSQAPKKSLLPPSRIAVIVFAIVAVVIIVFEIRARSQWDSTYTAIGDKIDASDGVPKSVVDQLVQGSPKRQATKESELFTWSGILQSYRMRVYYSGDVATRIVQE